MTRDPLNFLDLWASQNICMMHFVSGFYHLHHFLKCLHMAMEAITSLTRLKNLRIWGHKRFKTRTISITILAWEQAGVSRYFYCWCCPIRAYVCVYFRVLIPQYNFPFFFLFKNMINNVQIRLKRKLKFPFFSFWSKLDAPAIVNIDELKYVSLS